MASAGVELRFPPVPEHVRTARLVATAVARRAGLGEARQDEVRLAVGEACARAVRRCQTCAVDDAVVLRIDDTGPGLVVDVVDRAPLLPDDGPVVLALLQELADEVQVARNGTEPPGFVRLRWLPRH